MTLPEQGHAVKPLLIDGSDAAALLGLFDAEGKPRKSWVLREARNHRIPHVRLGKFVMFDPTTLEAWSKALQRGDTGS